MTTEPASETDGQVVKVTFYGVLPEGAKLFPQDDPGWLDAAGALKDLFGFTGIAHLTVSRGKTYEEDTPEPDEVSSLMRGFAESRRYVSDPAALAAHPEGCRCAYHYQPEDGQGHGAIETERETS